MGTKLTIQNVSLAGEFYVLAQLAIRNIIGTLTLGNTKAVDILATNPKTGKMFKIEVKTCSTGVISSKQFNGKHHEWQMDEKHESIIDRYLYYCFVSLNQPSEMPLFFIVPSEDVAKYVEWEHKYWKTLPHKRAIKDDSKKRIFRIKAMEVSTYENNWTVFET